MSPVKYEKTTGGNAAAATTGAQRNFDFESSTLNMNTGTKSGLETTTASNQDAEHIYTFFDDIRYIPEIHEIASACQTVVQNTINNMKKFLLKFRNYKHLWRTDKVRDELFFTMIIEMIRFSWPFVKNSLPKIHRWAHSMKK